MPATRAVPASGGSSVVRMRTAVVLPAPLGPSRPRMLPWGTARSSPSSAVTSPNRLTSPDVEIMSVTSNPLRSKWSAPLIEACGTSKALLGAGDVDQRGGGNVFHQLLGDGGLVGGDDNLAQPRPR